MTIGACSRLDVRTLPTIRGAGLDLAEFFRVNGARNEARYRYGVGCPEDAWTPGEADRVGDLAATEELKRVLRDRTRGTARICA